MGIGIILQELLKEKNSNVNEVSTATGVSPSTLYSIIRRDSMSANIQDLYKVAHYLGVSLEYFYSGTMTTNDNMNKPSLSNDAIKLAQDYDKLDTWGQQAVRSVAEVEKSRMKDELQKSVSEPEIIASIPYAYDLAASAGLGEYAMDIAHFETVGLSEAPPHGADFLIRIDGDSMEPKYSHDDKVYIKRQDSVNEGEIGLFYLDGNVYIKKQGYNELISLNPKYDPIPVLEYSTSKCFGRILGKCDSIIIEL